MDIKGLAQRFSGGKERNADDGGWNILLRRMKKTTTGNLSEFTVVSGELICCKWIVDKLQKEGG